MSSHFGGGLGLWFIALLGLLHTSTSHADDKPITPEKITLGRPVDFGKDIEPILEQNCIACHNEAIDESGLNLETVPAILKGGKHGSSVVKGKPDESLLFLVAARMPSKVDAMPPLPNEVDAVSLTPKQVGLIRQWIVEGAKGSGPKAEVAVNWQPLAGKIAPIYSVALAPHSDVVAVGRANQIVIHDVHSGQKIASLTDPLLQARKTGSEATFGAAPAHRDFVNALAFSPDGKTLASGGYRVVKLWQRADALASRPLPVNEAVLQTVPSADQKTAWVVTKTGKIHLVDLVESKVVRTLNAPSQAVVSVDPAADGKQLLVAMADGSLSVHSTADGKSTLAIKLPQGVVTAVWNRAGNRFIVAHSDMAIRQWVVPESADKFDGKPELELKGHSKAITAMVKEFRSADRVVTVSEDGTARLWNMAAKRQERSYAASGQVLTDVAVSADGKYVAMTSRNGSGRLFELANGRQISELRLNLEAKRAVEIETENATVAAQMVTLANTGIKDAETTLKSREEGVTKSRAALETARKAVPEAEKKLSELKTKRDAAKMALDAKPEDNKLQKTFDDANAAFQKGEDEVKRAKTAEQAAQRAVTRADASLEKSKEQLAAAKQTLTTAEAAKKSADETLAKIKPNLQQVVPQTSVSFSPDSNSLAITSDDGRVGIFEVVTGQPVALSPAGEPVSDLHWLTANELLTVSAKSGASLTTRYPEWNLVATLGPSDPASETQSDSPLTDRVLALDFSSDGKLLAAAGGEPTRDGELTLFDVASRTVVRTFVEPHSDSIHSVDFSRDGTHLVTAAADKFVKLFKVENGEMVQSYEGHTNHVLDARLSSDAATLITAGADEKVKIWKTWTGEQVRTVTTQKQQVTSLRVVGTKAEYVSGAGDKTVRLNRVSNGQTIRSFGGNTDYVYAVDVNRDGSRVVAGGEDGTLRIYDGVKGSTLHQLPAE